MQWISDIKYQDPRTRTHLGGPSIVRVEDRTLVAIHCYGGIAAPKNSEGMDCLTSVYRSQDEGETWELVNHLVGAKWSTLFGHRGDLYILGVSAAYGHIVIRRSTDNGLTWTHPIDEGSGLLFRGGQGKQPPNYHCAPTPVVEHRGRLYRAFEDNDPIGWPQGFQACVISCPTDADLLKADSWVMSNKLPYDPTTDPPEFGGAFTGGVHTRKVTQAAGWLEGNIVVGPDGALWNVMRVNSAPVCDRVAFIRVLDEGREIRFDPADFVAFPGGMSKFTIRRDPVDGLYWTLSNNITNPAYPSQRNVLSLHVSSDLRRWRHAKTVLVDDRNVPEHESISTTGFQYVDWQFDGDNLIYVARVAYDGSPNYHDANRIVFGRVPSFRRCV